MLNDQYNQSRSLQLFSEICKTNRYITDAAVEHIKLFGLNLTEFAVLELLFHKGDTPIQHIGKRILISSGNMTYVLDKLEAKGFIKRLPCPKDRRVTYAVLTDEGRHLISSIFPEHELMIDQLFSQINKTEKEMLIYLLKKMGLNQDI